MYGTVCTSTPSIALQCRAASIENQVIRVADGDTITVIDSSDSQHKIRFGGIDAPKKEAAKQSTLQTLPERLGVRWNKELTVNPPNATSMRCEQSQLAFFSEPK